MIKKPELVESTSNIVALNKDEMTPDKALEMAKGKLSSVLIIGWDKEDGVFTYFNNSLLNNAERLYLLEVMRFTIMEDNG